MTGQPFAGKVRVRVNGLLVHDRSLLLVKLQSKTRSEPFWIPPGGGLELGETIEEALIRELKEETGLSVTAGPLLYISEYIQLPWHAVEFYFQVFSENYNVHLGNDPELDGNGQLLQDIRFVPFSEFKDMNIVPEYLKNQFIQDYLTGRQTPMFIRAGYEQR